MNKVFNGPGRCFAIEVRNWNMSPVFGFCHRKILKSVICTIIKHEIAILSITVTRNIQMSESAYI